MSLKDLLVNEIASSDYRSNREKWHREVARRALLEAGSRETPKTIVKILLEGDLAPWSKGYDFFPNDGLVTMSWLAAGGDNPRAVFQMLRKKYVESEPRCQEVWTGEHVAYRCFTCGISENSCMCVYCFDANDHENHEFRLYRSSAGGCCDCGDPQAWRESGFCKRHQVPKEKRPSMVSRTVASGAKIACKAVVEHLVWALRRCFFLGKHRPERSGAFAIARCFEWLSEITSVCPELCLAASEALNENRDVCNELIGWGNYCSAFASDLVADETATAALLRLGCYLPNPLSFDLGALFLKLLLEPQYKSQFTSQFVKFLPEYLGLLLNGGSVAVGSVAPGPPQLRLRKKKQLGLSQEPEMAVENEIISSPASSTSVVPVEDDHDEGEGEDEEDDEDYDEEVEIMSRNSAFDFAISSQPPPRYTPPKAPSVLSSRDLCGNARQFLDRIYCQLFHSEQIALQHVYPLLNVMLPMLALHFEDSESRINGQLKLAKIRRTKSFYRRVLSQLNLILQHDSVCLIIFGDTNMFWLISKILWSCQLMDSQRRREPHEDHIERPSLNFKTAFGLLYELEEQMIAPLLKSARAIVSEHLERPSANSHSVVSLMLTRLAELEETVDLWTQFNERELKRPGVFSAHVPLNRFLFRYLDVLLSVLGKERMSNELARIATDQKKLLSYVMPSVQVLNFIFQIQDQLWVRNGQTMFNSVLWYLKIFSFSTLEADLLTCRMGIQTSSSPQEFLEEMFEEAESLLGSANAIKLFGSLSLQGTTTTSVRRSAIHCLASRNFTFSELDNQCPPRSTKELELVLKDIADFHDASAHPGGSPAHYTLKSQFWDEVEFGGFYLRWLRIDEENALTRYRRAKNKREDETNFFPITSFPSNEISSKVLNSVSLRGACLKLCASSSVNADVKTMCCLLMIAALRLEERRSEDDLFPRQSFLDMFDLLQAHVPASVLDEFVRLLRERYAAMSFASASSPQLHPMNVVLDEDADMSARRDSTTEESLATSGSAKRSKTKAAASRAQQKALRAFAKKQKKFQLAEEEEEEVASTSASLAGSLDTGSGFGMAMEQATSPTTTAPAVAFKEDEQSNPSHSASSEKTERSSEAEDQQVCSLCRKPANYQEECLSLLVCSQPSNLLYTLESSAIEGEGKCIARSVETRCPLPTDVEGEEVPYLAPRSLLTCINTLRERFNTGEYSSETENETELFTSTPGIRSDDESFVRSVNSTRTLLHSCGHLVHQSCLNRYRQVLMTRSQMNQPYEGQGVVKLYLNELFCPVCRRVTNELLPLLPSAFSSSSQGEASSSTMSTPSSVNMDVVAEDEFGSWMKSRLEEYSTSLSSSPLINRKFDMFAEECRGFFIRCPSQTTSSRKGASSSAALVAAAAASFQISSAASGSSPSHPGSSGGLMSTSTSRMMMTIDPAGLILTQLYASGHSASSSSTSSTIRSLLPSLLDLALRHPHLPASQQEEEEFGMTQTEQIISTWSKFVNERFWGERPGRRRRQSCLSADLTLVLIEWLILNPSLRFRTVSSPLKPSTVVLVEAQRALELLLHFARLQDLLLREIYRVTAVRTSAAEDPPEAVIDDDDLLAGALDERGASKQSDALRAIAMKTALRDLDNLTRLHRLNSRQRTSLEQNVELVVESWFDAEGQNVEPAIAKLVKDHCPADCLPFVPSGPQWESRVDALKRHAVLLLGPDVLLTTPTSAKDLPELSRRMIKMLMKKVLVTFFKEVNELVGMDDRPVGTAVTAAKLKFSAMLPSVFPIPTQRFTALVRLPHDYSALTVAYVARGAICTKCESVPEFPAICLACGLLVCCNGACCAVNGVDELFSHGTKCARGIGKSTGVFLLLKTCVVVVLLGEDRHCVWGSLYLDAHDEEDRNLTRGKPLKLNLERFDALERVYKTSAWMLETRVLDHVRIN